MARPRAWPWECVWGEGREGAGAGSREPLARPPRPPLTYCFLAVEDREAAVHAGRQEQVLLAGVPPEPPHPALRGQVCERLLHVPSVPQENVLVVAETDRPQGLFVQGGQCPLVPQGPEEAGNTSQEARLTWPPGPSPLSQAQQ